MNHKTVLLYAFGALLLIACGARAEEQKAAAPAATHEIAAPSTEKAGKPLTPEQKEQLQEEESAVFDITPG